MPANLAGVDRLRCRVFLLSINHARSVNAHGLAHDVDRETVPAIPSLQMSLPVRSCQV